MRRVGFCLKPLPGINLKERRDNMSSLLSNSLPYFTAIAKSLPYFTAIAATVAVFTIRFLLDPALGSVAQLLLFTLSVVAAAWHGGLGPGLLATGLGALLADYFFME